ncbi:fatty-acyl-CoA synthase [Azospirillum fermentarium]|uniref:acyl-CoA synthetase n=1 Tax=Azospirillum fermentarium TaxID=1233114 RepID=UPI002225CA9B|nr:acyl-CoA synthetase [Azospirillum fermentarium]MCW2247204.1 fatty-acyl-CoA synthase [Azospirillum fermentarium]
MSNPYDTHLDRNAANTEALSPLSFLRRTADIYPNRPAVVHGPVRRTWKETYERCVRLASALAARGIGVGDTVAVMAPNIPESFEAHFGVPMAGAVLCALNIRLDAEALAFILGHGEAKILLTDREFSGVITKALALMPADARPIVIDIDDPQARGGSLIGEMDYEAFLATGNPAHAWTPPADEWQAIALNYTSGTTGNPKGVVYHHRGAYLNAMGNVLTWAMPHHPVYLWTLPMFHCNGWCFPWTVAAMAGVNVCLRVIAAKTIYDAMADEGVTHLCGAPIIMGLLCNAGPDQKRDVPRGIRMMTAGAAPPAAVIEKMEGLGFDITHVYGLTEVYGPVTICAWHDDWNGLPLEEKARLKARQGVRYATLEGLMVADPATLEPVPADGTTMGEVFMRGNTVMKGYLKNPKATDEAFQGGWFHTGDLGVLHPDGYIELKDRSKDIIISGGENISTIEVEGVLYRHPAVLEAAVVARPDEKWGETPCAFVTLREGMDAGEDDIIHWCRQHLAHFKCPRTVVFAPLPKTSTGKIQKFALRAHARALNDLAEAEKARQG